MKIGAAMHAGRAVHGRYRQGWHVMGSTAWRESQTKRYKMETARLNGLGELKWI